MSRYVLRGEMRVDVADILQPSDSPGQHWHWQEHCREMRVQYVAVYYTTLCTQMTQAQPSSRFARIAQSSLGQK